MATILVAVDGSDLARMAAGAARKLLGEGHTWELIAAVSPHGDPGDSVIGRLDQPTLSAEVIAEHVHQAEQEALQVGRALGMTGEVRVETGEPGPVICETAELVDADLIVVGSHGRGRLGRTVLGSVSTHVLGHAPCPVMVYRDPTARQ
jgi:nucleotide-binding universal stress UspA family protein